MKNKKEHNAHTYRQTDKQTDRETDRQTIKQSDWTVDQRSIGSNIDNVLAYGLLQVNDC